MRNVTVSNTSNSNNVSKDKSGINLNLLSIFLLFFKTKQMMFVRPAFKMAQRSYSSVSIQSF